MNTERPPQAVDATPPAAAPAAPPDPWLRRSLGLLCAALIVAALYLGRDVLMPLALAALLSFVLDPLVSRLRHLGLPRAMAVAVVLGLTLAVMAAASLFVASQIASLGKDLPTYQKTVQGKLRELRQSVTGGGGNGGFSQVSKLVGVVEKELDAARDAFSRASGQPAAGPATPAPTNGAAAPVTVQVRSEPPASTPAQALAEVVLPLLAPLATAGIVLVLMFFILLDRNDLRDRLLRLIGGDPNPASDALAEAGRRVSRYLVAQVLVNLGYGLVLSLGLWALGVPGALLWGLLGAVLRFLPYVGPLLAAVCPIALAFAVDPGWSVLLWTLGLIAALELVINNLVEPWLYGSSTGLAPVAILLAAAFWATLWGPVGLVLATPITVCLAVLGRHLPALQTLDVLLSSEPAFKPPMRLYQRLLGRDLLEARAQARQHAGTPTDFFAEVAIPALRLADAGEQRLSRQRQRRQVGRSALALLDQWPPQGPGDQAITGSGTTVLCLGLEGPRDLAAARMLVHALRERGLPARWVDGPAAALAQLTQQAQPAPQAHAPVQAVQTVFISGFDPAPAAFHALAQRLRAGAGPGLQVVAAPWELPGPLDAAAFGADAVVTRLPAALDLVAPSPPAPDGDEALPPSEGTA